jgi:uncharacterized alpha-E superfamily protein
MPAILTDPANPAEDLRQRFTEATWSALTKLRARQVRRVRARRAHRAVPRRMAAHFQSMDGVRGLRHKLNTLSGRSSTATCLRAAHGRLEASGSKYAIPAALVSEKFQVARFSWTAR